ncbi:copper-exporting P-type ATPase A [Paenibacillus marchantiophytorum]|uniref:P-type Cu(+) transporter n=1 Tax=Paenibacillus marchantiophytorum TaxID=1619310 RepID=A0ABQ1FJ81_9BACL|nr:heavy metal translocating P-type ATPase [Paenibacillus marchantiophytorum]GGA14469.1 copper-exporting P-type ATPase A [Paenibacillus marchantiophytorum]
MNEQVTFQKINLEIEGMTCAACSARIEKVIGKMAGVHEIAVNLPLGRAALVLDASTELKGKIIERMEQLGYSARSFEEASDSRQSIVGLGTKLVISALLTLPLLWAMVRHYTITSGIWIPDLFLEPWFQLLLATPVQFVIGAPFYFNAWKAVKSKSANMDVLIVLSTTCAYLYSHYMTMHMLRSGGADPHAVYYETSAMIITVVLLGKWLEASAKERSMKTVHQLRRLSPQTVTVIRNEKQTETISIKDVCIGDSLLILTGEVVPADGRVIRGRSNVDEAFITGESVPVEKRQYDRLIGGSVNRDETITMQVTALGPQTALGKMIRLMEDAQASKTEIGRYVDRIAAVFVPAVLMLALLTLCMWSLWLTPGDFKGALFKAIAVLVIACPCALGLATPTSILVGTSRALESGILFKEGKYVEQLQQIDIILMDKTGTLTHGTPRVTDIITDSGQEHRLLRMLAAAENGIEHPYAKAIMKEAARRGFQVKETSSSQALTGLGVTARVDKHEIHIGSRAFMSQTEISTQKFSQVAEQLERQGKTILFAAVDGVPAGVIALMDTLKSSTPQAIRRLKKMGIVVAMVTGDHRKTANAIADKAGITAIYAEMQPQDKVHLVRMLQQKGRRVAMVGDGVNDAPALAAADIGIAVGTGSEIAKDAADVNLLHSDLGGVADAMVMSRKTMRNIRQNLLFALMYNVLAIPLAFMGLMTPWIAGTAMALSSVSVVANASRLQKASWRN